MRLRAGLAASYAAYYGPFYYAPDAVYAVYRNKNYHRAAAFQVRQPFS